MARKPAAKPDGPLPRILLLYGKEAYLIARESERLKARLQERHGEVEVFLFDGAAARPADVLDECRTFALIQQHKLVIVDQADQFVKDESRPLVERYAQAPSQDATLLLRSEKWNKGKLDALIQAVGDIKRCDPETPADAARLAVEIARQRHDAHLQQDAADLLVQRLGPDLARIDTELAKLALSVEPAAPITPRDVLQLVGVSREEAVWAIQSALLTENPELALRSIRDALDISRHPTVLISYACIDLARKVHAAARGLAKGERAGDLIRRLRLWGDSADPVLSAARRLGPRRAADLLAAAVEADARQKTGVGEPERILESLALRFAIP